MAPGLNIEAFSKLTCCPAAEAGYQRLRQQALTQGIANSGKYGCVVSCVAMDFRNEKLLTCLKSTGIADVRDWGKLFIGLLEQALDSTVEAMSTGDLTSSQYALVKEHPQASYDLLKDINFSWPVADIVYQHHERLDGSGYPQGLKGNKMLPETCILAVADVFEAMSSHRPYRPAPGVETALEELERDRGALYDPDAVDACVRLVRDRGFTLDDV